MYKFGIPFKFYLVLLVLLMIGELAKAQAPTNDGKMKSELILKLVDQIEWPNKHNVSVGVVGQELNFSKNLIRKASVLSNSVQLEKDLSKCDIIYVPIGSMNKIDLNAYDALVITANKSNASMYFDYENGAMMIKTADAAEAAKKGLSADFQLIAP